MTEGYLPFYLEVSKFILPGVPYVALTHHTIQRANILNNKAVLYEGEVNSII